MYFLPVKKTIQEKFYTHYAPKGGGKTTWLANKIVEFIKNNPEKRALVLTHSFVAKGNMVYFVLNALKENQCDYEYIHSVSRLTHINKSSVWFRYDDGPDYLGGGDIHGLTFDTVFVDNADMIPNMAELEMQFIPMADNFIFTETSSGD